MKETAMSDNTVGTTAAEPIVAYSTTSYNDVMNYLHSIRLSREDKERVGRRLVVEVTEPALADAYDQIDHLSTLPQNWDGEGALPISKRVLDNLRQVLMVSDNADWEHWAISPDSTATVGLQSTTSRAFLSLGSREYSYYARKDGRRIGESHVPFAPESFLQVMRQIG